MMRSALHRICESYIYHTSMPSDLQRAHMPGWMNMTPSTNGTWSKYVMMLCLGTSICADRD
jgi:hypothetical protein